MQYHTGGLLHHRVQEMIESLPIRKITSSVGEWGDGDARRIDRVSWGDLVLSNGEWHLVDVATRFAQGLSIHSSPKKSHGERSRKLSSKWRFQKISINFEARRSSFSRSFSLLALEGYGKVGLVFEATTGSPIWLSVWTTEGVRRNLRSIIGNTASGSDCFHIPFGLAMVLLGREPGAPKVETPQQRRMKLRGRRLEEFVLTWKQWPCFMIDELSDFALDDFEAFSRHYHFIKKVLPPAAVVQ
ncbi:hypothetical protein Tco_0626374 [Tanacetum coccineum]|uniref:Uncharacterized protein n=1 Tax=Tanacetum coccineum TaxID=301880 RepID=A0ABQ4WJD4_9ASTR